MHICLFFFLRVGILRCVSIFEIAFFQVIAKRKHVEILILLPLDPRSHHNMGEFTRYRIIKMQIKY